MKAMKAMKVVSVNEKAMIARLKSECGAGMEMNVSVLTQSFWPTYQQVQVNLPADMLLQQGVFKDFYLSKHSGRRLHWHDSLGQCVLKVNFEGGKKEVVTSLFQALVLLLFQEDDELSVAAA